MIIKNKRGDATEGLTFIIIIFVLAISLIISGFVVTKMILVVKNTPLNQTAVSAQIIEGMDNLSTNGVNKAFVFIFSGLILGMFLSSFLVRVHPAFLFIYVIMLIFAGFVALLLTNVYNAFVANQQISAYASSLTGIDYIMKHSLKILIAVVCISLIILFAKPPESTPI